MRKLSMMWACVTCLGFCSVIVVIWWPGRQPIQSAVTGIITAYCLYMTMKRWEQGR